MESDFKVLYNTILKRKEDGGEGSYTSYLFNSGKEKILKKFGEESTEVIIASMVGKKDEQIEEIGDLLYHLFVLMANEGITLEDVEEELKSRSKKINNFKGERKDIENI